MKIENLGGTAVQGHLRMGGAAEEVVALAEGLGVGLVILGSRGRGRIRRLLMGSVSDSVVRHAHCPVLVVRWKTAGFPAKILLATDGSEEAALAAKTAADLAKSTESELHVAHVGRELTHGSYSGVDVGPLPGIHQDELDEQAQELLEAEVGRVKVSGIEITQTHRRTGKADEEIIVLAEEFKVDLIVMGGRDLGGVRRTLMGSVSDSVVRHAHCPVMVVRREEERATYYDGSRILSG